MCNNKTFIASANFAVPCGKCYDCTKRKITDWTTRLHFETMYSKSEPIFLTLTYNDEHLKKPHPNARYATLCKRDLQLFFKRLRKNSKQAGLIHTKDLRYLAVGEYGSKNKRPHYHLLLFNSNHQQCINAWKKGGKEIGEVYFGDVTEKSIAYVVGYALATKSHQKHVFQNNLIGEFHLYSNGLGKVYTTRTAAIFHNRRVYEGEHANFIMIDGVKRPIPRYYADKIYTPTIKQELKKQLLAEHETEKVLSLKQLNDLKHESDRKLRQRRKSATL
jgi:hypothetical protein